MQYDLVIRGGLVVDGSGGKPFLADVAVQDGRIAAVAAGLGAGAEEIDAQGLIVTPGFVDIHTHYDGQVTWDERMRPSSAHGVTTAVIGNCGVGFAPCRPAQQDDLIRLMEGVEDIPNPVLTEGLPWTWESFPEYLAWLDGRRYDLDVAALVPHAALRVFVMGERGVKREPATAADRAAMAELLDEAMAAGAVGLGTSRTMFHRSSDGTNIATFGAAEEELGAFAEVLRRRDAGMLQVVTDFSDEEAEFALLHRLALRAGRPVTFSLAEGTRDPVWRRTLQRVLEANQAGADITAQTLGRPVGALLGHGLTLHPFCTSPAYRALAGLPPAEKIARLREPALRAEILENPGDPDPANAMTVMVRRFDLIFALGAAPDYEPDARSSLAARAEQAGVSPLELAYDLLLENDGQSLLYLALANYPNGNLESTREMLTHPNVVFGLGDGGAHCGTICDASYSTFALTHWVRDRAQGRLPLEAVIRQMTSATARLVGLQDRGRIQPGYRADLNVIDLERLQLLPPYISHDLPAGGRRLLQQARGYAATILAGQMVARNDQPTPQLPGRLVRGGQKISEPA
jgi:N-acyl-D-aspartate/D-glutamate deacylase